MHSSVIRRDEIMARKDVGRFPSLAIRTTVPDENNNNRPQSTLVERDPLSLFFTICIGMFCPVQLQMVIFDFKEEETETDHVFIATSKSVPSGIFLRVQQPCEVSIALLHYYYSALLLCHTTVLAQPVTSSVAKFA